MSWDSAEPHVALVTWSDDLLHQPDGQADDDRFTTSSVSACLVAGNGAIVAQRHEPRRLPQLSCTSLGSLVGWIGGVLGLCWCRDLGGYPRLRPTILSCCIAWRHGDGLRRVSFQSVLSASAARCRFLGKRHYLPAAPLTAESCERIVFPTASHRLGNPAQTSESAYHDATVFT